MPHTECQKVFGPETCSKICINIMHGVADDLPRTVKRVSGHSVRAAASWLGLCASKLNDSAHGQKTIASLK